MALDWKECAAHGMAMWRDGECLECRPIETFNLNSSSPTPGLLAAIATHLERYGKVTVIYSALMDMPGASAMLLGKAYAEAEAERLKTNGR